MYVIGTAGHVDHGKSTLIEALTGIDPDRLREEKERGLTIDLGFAWLNLPSGKEVSIVDVPGHERFIKNMLSGVGAIDLAMLIVAADESVMPQTLEHLAILDLLSVRKSFVVITKSDLVDNDLLELVKLEVEEAVKGTKLESSPVLCVSSTTKEGLRELIGELDSALGELEERPDLGRPRLAIDRSFSISGFGTVVTGTLIDGVFKLGQEVFLARRGVRSRIRGIQAHKSHLEIATPGTRIAVNLMNIKAENVSRGEILTIPGWLNSTRAIDAKVKILNSVARPIRHNFPITVHVYSAETTARLRLLNQDFLKPGQEGWAQLWLDEHLPLVRGDRFIFRSTDQTIGGGVIVDLDSKKHRRKDPAVIDYLDALIQEDPLVKLETTLESVQPSDVKSISRLINLPLVETIALIEKAVSVGFIFPLGNAIDESSDLLTVRGWRKVSNKAISILTDFHKENPLKLGMSLEEFRKRLALKERFAQSVLNALLKTGDIEEDGHIVRLENHSPILTVNQQSQIDDFLAILSETPFPTDQPSLPVDLQMILVDRGEIIRLGSNMAIKTNYYKMIQSKIINRVKSEGQISLSDTRDLLGTSRKYAQSILEHMDDEKITRRVGDIRILL